MIILNFANMDMVGHTGIFEAAVKAVETVDDCVGKIETVLKEVGGAADYNCRSWERRTDGKPDNRRATYRTYFKSGKMHLRRKR